METNVQRIKHDIEKLAQFTATPGKGVTRFSYTLEDRAARSYIKEQMQQAELAIFEDAAGTVIGRRPGEVEGPAVLVGSHFDSVKHGGAFDGTAGVVVALEIARVLKEENITTRYPIEVIAMVEEEGGRFGGGLLASQAMAGMVTEEMLTESYDAQGVSLAKAMVDFGLNPDIKAAQRRPEELKAFFELHVEQGIILESEGIDLGLVQAIVGMREYEVEITGRPDHAGTTPMNLRADALIAASQVVQQVRQIALDVGGGAVGTVGRLEVLPGAGNIVPGQVRFSVDLRSHEQTALDSLAAKLKKAVQAACKPEGLTYAITDKMNVKPVSLPSHLRDLIAKEAKDRGISTRTMVSGAGHDTQVMATLTDAALIFVPSKDGRSHCPEEWTAYADLKKGADVLLGAVVTMANQISNDI